MSSFFSLLSKLLVIFALAILMVYLLPKSPDYPEPLPDSVQSLEDADIEDSHERRAYFTNLSREEVLKHYEEAISPNELYRLLTYRVAHPPEDAFTIIRDQTRSVHLPEIIHPLRESVYVNFFEPSSPKDEIWYKGIHYERKITIRYVPSPVWPRIILSTLALFLILKTARELFETTFQVAKLFFQKNK